MLSDAPPGAKVLFPVGSGGGGLVGLGGSLGGGGGGGGGGGEPADASGESGSPNGLRSRTGERAGGGGGGEVGLAGSPLTSVDMFLKIKLRFWDRSTRVICSM